MNYFVVGTKVYFLAPSVGYTSTDLRKIIDELIEAKKAEKKMEKVNKLSREQRKPFHYHISDELAKICNNASVDDIRGVLSLCNDYRQELIVLKFGLDGRNPMGFAEIARTYDVTSSAIQRTVRQTIRLIKVKLQIGNAWPGGGMPKYLDTVQREPPHVRPSCAGRPIGV